ncbi:hypothetical protein PENSOL_c020G02928 [Penicillium solitum]|uniref:Major facilitator superfamily (MFS) profile domain-containing protein n=1 Tax=Penicillium solitum TaxID=60172 RepID=A0A1V6R1S3_9EURO|nr:uncharacterized protein PENSOL_c020G02928 [Penicillium solitum]OQD95420.1 hypothetical protein PENSOL_c020G02928 [Penicillium solitum]
MANSQCAVLKMLSGRITTNLAPAITFALMHPRNGKAHYLIKQTATGLNESSTHVATREKCRHTTQPNGRRPPRHLGQSNGPLLSIQLVPHPVVGHNPPLLNGGNAPTLSITESEANMVVSIFVLAFAFGPMALAPLAKVFGRRWVWILSSTWYIPWNTVCGFSHTRGQLLAGRILSGIGASAEYAITTPVLADCWRAEQRGQSFAIATFVPLLGPAIGPILGGIITEKIGWRWLF